MYLHPRDSSITLVSMDVAILDIVCLFVHARNADIHLTSSPIQIFMV